MIQQKYQFTEIIKFIEKNISLLIIIPASIGGLWQLIELASISIPLVRFFSISQMVPDGLVVLIFLLMGFGLIGLGWFADDLFFYKLEAIENSRENQKTINNTLVVNFILFIIVYVVSVFSIWNYSYINRNYFDFIIFIIQVVFLLKLTNSLLNNCFLLASEKIKFFFKFCNFLLLIMYILVFNTFAKIVHNKFLLTSHLDNIENLNEIVNKKYPSAKKEILYFNDKYFFYSISIKSGNKKKAIEKIHIVEINNLFKE